MNAASTITAITPVYNGERYLAKAIRSVLDQTLPPDEIIVVADGSTDASAEVARAFGPPVRVLTQANLGPAAARNWGVAHATGDLLAFLDADDLWLPDKLARQVQVLHDAPACEAVLGGVENFISPELDDRQQQMLTRSAGQHGTHHIGALLIRTASFRRIGMFDDRWRHGEFIEWWARAGRLALCHTILPELVMRRRLHANNLTRSEQDGRREYLTMLREHMRSLREESVRHHA